MRIATTLFVLASAARGQDTRWHVPADERTELFGERLTWIDDVDADGVPDVAASARLDPIDPPDRNNPNDDDRVRLLSGADLSLLRELRRDDACEFGIDLARCGDHDGDGIDDLVVAQWFDGLSGGVATVFSVVTGEALLEYRASDVPDWTDVALATLDDIDGDGLDELVLGLPRADHGGGAMGTLRVLASRDGATLAEWHGDDPVGLGRRATFCVLDDADLDGRRDLALVDPDGPTDFVVTLYSGATFATITTRTISKSGFGLDALGTGGDANLDGYSDLVLLVSKSSGFTASDTLALSGRNLSTIWTKSSSLVNLLECRPAGDANGDGRGDYATSMIIQQTGPIFGTQFSVQSGKDGSTIYNRIGDSYPDGLGLNPRFALSDGAAPDLDGDGKPEQLYGYYDAASFRTQWGVGVHSQALGWDLLHRLPHEALHHFHGVAIAGDVDADGWNDVVTLEVVGSTNDDRFDRIATRSGRDGTLLRELLAEEAISADMSYWDHGFGTWSNLVSAPDLDGDGLVDYVVTRIEWPELVVEARSGRDDSLLAEIHDADYRGDPSVAAVGQLEVTGTALLALGFAQYWAATDSGEVRVYDLTAGTRAWAHPGITFEHLGSSLAWVHDIDGDGSEDLAAGAPNGAGRVALLSGADGSEIGSIAPPVAGHSFGTALASLPDVDGDGIGELLVSHPGQDPIDSSSPQPGALLLLRGGHWNVLSTMLGDLFSPNLGQVVGWVPDANGDGNVEVLGTTPGVGFSPGFGFATLRLALYSPFDGSRLERISDQTFDRRVLLATGASWLPDDRDGDARGLAATIHALGKGVTVFTLPDLYLTVTPETAAPGAAVTAEIRGGPPHASAGLYLVAQDGVPVESFLALGLLDGLGAWTFSDVVPPELFGSTMTLRAYAVGFDGRLARSREQALEVR